MSDGYLHKSFAAGTEIFRGGDLGDSAYLIDEGEVEIVIPLGAGKFIRNRLGPGQLFGEMALIDDAPRSGSAVAVTDTSARMITSSQILDRLRGSDEIIAYILKITLMRYRQALRQMNRGDDAAADGEAAPQVLGGFDGRAAMAKLTLENELREAITQGQLRLYYQPLVRLEDGRLAGFEALMRWQHPERGLVSPAEFIPLAEESGLVVPMCRWALNTAAPALARFHEAAGQTGADRNLMVSVNVTKHQIDDVETMTILNEIADGAVIPPETLKLELTESVLMNDYSRAKGWISDLQSRKFKLSIDDFGTGYSSLGYLHQFGVDELKIDRSFVIAMLADSRSMEIVRAIIGLAKGLGLRTVAEGIEYPAEAERLREAGCDLGQGYLFARPTPEAEVLTKLRAGAPGFIV